MKQMGMKQARVELSRIFEGLESVEVTHRGVVLGLIVPKVNVEGGRSEANVNVQSESSDESGTKVNVGGVLADLRAKVAQIESGNHPVDVPLVEERREVPAHLCEEGQILTVSLRELQAREGPTKGLATWSQCRVIAKREVTPLGITVSMPDFSEVRSCPKPEKKKKA